MAIDFPASPTLNDTFSSGGVTYTWDGTVWVASGSAAFVQKSGDTITGNLTLNADLTVDTDTLYADSTNNNVGVGTTSPGSYNGSANQLVVSNSADDCGITINSDAASTGNIFFADGTSGSAVAEGYVKYNHSVNNLRFGANGSERMRIDSTGNVGIGSTTPAVKLDVAGEVRASTGVLFGTDTAATNTLDDYEEGTWTPVYAGATTAGSYTYTTQTGVYTKIGNRVTVDFKLLNITTSSLGSGNVRITGLPFTVGTTDLNAQGSIRISQFNVSDSTINITLQANQNTTECQITLTRDNTSNLSVDVNDKVTDGADIYGSVTYNVD